MPTLESKSVGMRRLCFWPRPRIQLAIHVLFGLILCLLLWPARTAYADTFTVTNSDDDGANTLREAIVDANATDGPHTILFNLGSGVQTINLLSPLPAITEQTEINALSGGNCAAWPIQPLVELNGASAGAGASGFTVNASGSRILGFYIHSFGLDGVMINTTDVIVGCNIIGLNPAGNDAGNGNYGVSINGSNNIVGNNGAILGNVISGNPAGVVIEPAVSGNFIRGNYIGTDVAGNAARPNDSAGITIVEALNTTIGGSAVADRNVLAGNTQQGVLLTFSGSGNKIMGNYIGTNAAGNAALPNGEDGIKIQSTADTTVGGTAAGEGNRIAHNTRNGILVTSGSLNNRFLGNEIFSNGQLGIDLSATFTSEGVTANDSKDVDAGTNGFQNFPVVLEALRTDANNMRVRGSINSTPNTVFRIEIFASETCDATGFGEGAIYLGATVLNTIFTGNRTFDFPLASTVPAGYKITATATSNSGNTPGNTSEFSVCQTLAGEPPPPNAPQLLPDTATTNEDTPVTIDVLLNDSSPNANPLTVVEVSSLTQGTAQIVGNKILYTPPASFSGEITFFYSAHSGDTSSSRQSTVKVTVNAVNDLPTDILHNITFNEKTPIPSVVGLLVLEDTEDNPFVSFALVDTGQPNDNDAFLLLTNMVMLTRKLDFTNRTNVTLGIMGRDFNGGTFTKNVVIPLPAINHIPDGVALSNDRINENQPAGLTVGTLTGIDVDTNDTHTFALVDGGGASDNARFRIEGNVLKTNALLDFEFKSLYSIRVRVTDNGGEFRDDLLTIHVNNLASPPDAAVNNLSFCTGGTITLIEKNSNIVSRRVFVTIGSVVISDLTNTGCTVNGKMTVVTNGNTVSNLPFTGKVNERNQFSSATIPDFLLSIAGLPLRAGGVEISYISERATLHITEPALTMPKEFGGLSAEISVPTQIDSNGIRFGTGNIKLPAISTASGFELGLSGRLEPSGEGFKISADGTISIPNIGKKSTGAAQTCAITAGVTIFADANGRTVMMIAAGSDLPGNAPTTVVVSSDPNADPNAAPLIVYGPEATDVVRLDSVRAGASCSPGLAIGTTGLFLTGLSGEITVTPGEERADVTVTIESGKSLPGIGPMLGIEGTMGLQPRPFKLDLGAAVQVLSIEVGRAGATITPQSFTASLSFRQIGYFGSVRVAAFAKDGRPTFTGSGSISLGVEKHAVFFLVPPFDVVLASAGADVGEFTNGNFGIKGTVNILSLATVGFFVDHRGNVALGDVSRFNLISGPTVAAARAAYLQATTAGTALDPTIASTYTFLEDESGTSAGVIIRTPLVKPTLNNGEPGTLATSDVITQINLLQHGDVIFGMAAHGPINLSLITPEGDDVTPANFGNSGALGYTIAYTSSLTYQTPDALERFADNDAPIVQDESMANLLFTPLNSSAGANNVDLIIDGNTVYFDLTFQNSVEWLKPIPLAAGEHSVQLVKHGTGVNVLDTTVNLAAGTDTTLVNVGGPAAGFATLTDNYDAPTTMGKAKVRFYNGANSTLKLLVNGTPLFSNVGYKAATNYMLVDAGPVVIEVRHNGTDELVSAPRAVDLADGGVYSFFSTDFTADGYAIALVQRQDALYAPTYLTYYIVDQAEMNEEWQMKLVGDTDNIPFQIAILGPGSPPVFANVTVDASNLATTEINWQLTADVQPVTVTVYANPGAVTTSLVVSNSNGTTSTQQIPIYEGFPIAEFRITNSGELGGQPVSKQINLSSLESGTYRLWIRADDGINAPVNAYAASALSKSDIGTLGIQSVYGLNTVWVAKDGYNAMAQLADAADIVVNRTTDFPTTWNATITTEFVRQSNSLNVAWGANAHPDADRYRLHIGYTANNPTEILEVGGNVAEFSEDGAQGTGTFIVRNIKPGVRYFISVEAVDTESGKGVRSQEVEFIAVPGGFAITSPQSTVNLDAGESITIPVTLVAEEALFFPNVWLSTNLGESAPGITAVFLNDLDGDAQLNPNAPTRDLQISVDASVPDGAYSLVITGYNGNARQALTVNVIVGEPFTGVMMPMIKR